MLKKSQKKALKSRHELGLKFTTNPARQFQPNSIKHEYTSDDKDKMLPVQNSFLTLSRRTLNFA